MQRIAFLCSALLLCCSLSSPAQVAWHLQPIPLQTRWAKEVEPTNALPEYPRPQMVRSSWINLNGLWDYAITAKGDLMPIQYTGKILVPYSIESALSGVKRGLLPSDNLWYRLTIQRPKTKTGDRVLLHFGAVDWQATIFVNGSKVGMHTGGYTNFTFDITDQLRNGSNELVVQVFDPTDQGVGPHGKQVLNPQSIYYTPTSGIWQTVWLETVPASYIRDIMLTPDIDHQVLQATVTAPDGYTVALTATAGGAVIGTVKTKTRGGKGSLIMPVNNPHLWTPADPFLYQLHVRLMKGDKEVDRVTSYFGMRKIGIAKDGQGIERICLNDKPYYNLGTLDQGFWPEGLYTAPTDEALAFDIKAIKAMGFNTIRKHIKVEPERWYYYADSLGILVWQDMVNPNQGLPEGAKPEFERESAEILHQLYNHPAITTWVLFNERWGQYDQERLTKWMKKTDPTRIVNGHTGELLYVNEQLRLPSSNPYIDADMTDVHSYPDPMMPILQPGKAQVLGEFGGIGVFIPDHQWNSSSAWGYIQERPGSMEAKYKVMNQHLVLLQRQGLSASIYTQPYDIEGEQNGLMTYDREIIKIPFDSLRAIHAALNPCIGVIPIVRIKDADLADPEEQYSSMLQQYVAAERSPAFLRLLVVKAIQAGDKAGAEQVGSDYVTGLRGALAGDDISIIAQFTRSTKDAGFSLMEDSAARFIAVMGERSYTVAMMNIIFRGEIDPMLTIADNPDWEAIGERVKPFGPPGDEIFLRVKTISLLNRKDWNGFVSVAKEYLKKYGKNLKQPEFDMFQNEIKEHE